MYLIDENTNRTLERITLLLNRSEAMELRDSIHTILNENSHHEHVSNGEYNKEITVSLYDENVPESYAPFIEKILNAVDNR